MLILMTAYYFKYKQLFIFSDDCKKQFFFNRYSDHKLLVIFIKRINNYGFYKE